MSKPKRSPAELRSMFGANLRQLANRYPSISELSRQLGINRTQFNRYLSGESFPRPDVLDRICSFFNVDARILLDPVDEISTRGDVLTGPYLNDFLGQGVHNLPEDAFPSGCYRFSRRSFVSHDQFVVGLIYVFRRDNNTLFKGFEAKEAMRAQGLPTDLKSREFRGYAARQEDGISLTAARRNSMTCSFNYLARIASMQNNFWVGYVTRTVRESAIGERVTRLVYEHLGNRRADIMAAARKTGFVSAEDMMPFHLRLLQNGEPFR